MVTTNQKSTIYIHTIKKKEFKHSIKDSHQIMRREPKRKGRKKDLPKKYKAINRVSVRTYISIITLNVNWFNVLTKRQRLAGWKWKQDIYIYICVCVCVCVCVFVTCPWVLTLHFGGTTAWIRVFYWHLPQVPTYWYSVSLGSVSIINSHLSLPAPLLYPLLELHLSDHPMKKIQKTTMVLLLH